MAKIHRDRDIMCSEVTPNDTYLTEITDKMLTLFSGTVWLEIKNDLKVKVGFVDSLPSLK